jgi:hypothetical protein
VPLPEKRENSPNKFENLAILAKFYEFKSRFEKSWLEKPFFIQRVFLNLHARGHSKSVTIF